MAAVRSLLAVPGSNGSIRGRPDSRKIMPELEPPAVTDTVRSEFDYKPWSSAYDEMITADGQFRPHWRDFADHLKEIGLTELRQRWNDAKHLIRENGVT